MICHLCETCYPDMCSDCKEVVTMDFTSVVQEDVQMFQDFAVKFVPRINISSGEDVQLEAY